MKKFILLLTTVLTLAFAASCFATENSSALNDAEGSAQKVITALVASDTLGYKDAEKAMSADLAKQMNVNTFIAMQRQVQEKFGKHKETKFFSFERRKNSANIRKPSSFRLNVLTKPTALPTLQVFLKNLP